MKYIISIILLDLNIFNYLLFTYESFCGVSAIKTELTFARQKSRLWRLFGTRSLQLHAPHVQLADQKQQLRRRSRGGSSGAGADPLAPGAVFPFVPLFLQHSVFFLHILDYLLFSRLVTLFSAVIIFSFSLSIKILTIYCIITWLLLLLSCFSHVRLCATPQTAVQQAPLSLGFSRQEHWSGLPFPSPVIWLYYIIIVINGIRVGHNWATELTDWQFYEIHYYVFI